jgi:hypothetical protein
MASSDDVPIARTKTGVRIKLDKLYLYPDGHANLVFGAVPDENFKGLNLPLTNTVDVLQELTSLVKRMQDEVVKKRPGQA